MTYHELPTASPQHREGGFLLGMVTGAAVGGGLALLFTPRDGATMRHDLADGAQQAGRQIGRACGGVVGTARRTARRMFGDQAIASDDGRALGGETTWTTNEQAATERSETAPGAPWPTTPPEPRSPLA